MFCKPSGRKNKLRIRKGSVRTSVLCKQSSWKISFLLLLLLRLLIFIPVYDQLTNLYCTLTKAHFGVLGGGLRGGVCCKDFKAPRIASVHYRLRGSKCLPGPAVALIAHSCCSPLPPGGGQANKTRANTATQNSQQSVQPLHMLACPHFKKKAIPTHGEEEIRVNKWLDMFLLANNLCFPLFHQHLNSVCFRPRKSKHLHLYVPVR